MKVYIKPAETGASEGSLQAELKRIHAKEGISRMILPERWSGSNQTAARFAEEQGIEVVKEGEFELIIAFADFSESKKAGITDPRDEWIEAVNELNLPKPLEERDLRTILVNVASEEAVHEQ